MLLLILLSVLIGCANADASQESALHVEGAYALPQYPSLAWRAWITGSYEVEISTEDGSVKEIKFLSNETMTVRKEKIPETNSISMDFVRAIETAVRSWKFSSLQSDRFRLTVLFGLVDTFYEPGSTHDYTIYRVDENPSRPPTRITIEAHRQGIKF
jgi:hypothetical protein